MKTFKEFIIESEHNPQEKLFSLKDEALIHHLILGHSGKDFNKMYENDSHLKPPEKPINRNSDEIRTAFYSHENIRDNEDIPEITNTYIKRSRKRLKEQGLAPATSTRKTGEKSYEDRVEDVGGIKRVFELRKKGKSDKDIFGNITPDQQEGIGKYIKDTHGDHPDYALPNRMREAKMNTEKREEVEGHLKSGLSIRKISEKTGIPVGSVARISSERNRN